MPFQIIRDDLTRVPCDAIINPTDSLLSGSGGTDAAVHAAAGNELADACRALGGCPPLGAVYTKGYRLPCRYVIHAAGPEAPDRAGLMTCCASALSLAEKLGCRSVALPLIAAGSLGFPEEDALSALTEAVRVFLEQSDMLVILVVFGKDAAALTRRRFGGLREYIDDNYAREHRTERSTLFRSPAPDAFLCSDMELSLPSAAAGLPGTAKAPSRAKPRFGLDESFSQAVLRLITDRGMTDPQCYKRANIDRRVFSKLRADSNYRPSKTTAVALAVALELSLPETGELLSKAGYALSHSILFDVIIEYCLKSRLYDVFEINEVLFEYDQPLLGC